MGRYNYSTNRMVKMKTLVKTMTAFALLGALCSILFAAPRFSKIDDGKDVDITPTIEAVIVQAKEEIISIDRQIADENALHANNILAEGARHDSEMARFDDLKNKAIARIKDIDYQK